jgi:hypothetical protein
MLVAPWQFGHVTFKFSNLLSVLSPFTWSAQCYLLTIHSTITPKVRRQPGLIWWISRIHQPSYFLPNGSNVILWFCAAPVNDWYQFHSNRVVFHLQIRHISLKFEVPSLRNSFSTINKYPIFFKRFNPYSGIVQGVYHSTIRPYYPIPSMGAQLLHCK